MKAIMTIFTTLALGVGVAACGSGSSTSTGASSAATGSAGAATTGAATTGAGASGSATTGAAAGSGNTGTSAGKAKAVVQQIAAATGALATGNSSQEQQARRRLQQLQSQARTVASDARAQLPASSPARMAIVQAANRAATGATKLSHATINAGTRQHLRHVQTTLNKLAANLGGVGGHLQQTSVTALALVAQNLVTLSHQLQSTGSAATG